MNIHIFTTGGTIDKIYFDAKSEFQIGEPQVAEMLNGVNVTVDFEVTALMREDSLDLTDEDRALIYEAVNTAVSPRIIITHGTDTMTQTADILRPIAGKTIVLTGALQPARFRKSDAIFNIASAFTAVQILPPGVYVAMSGRVFEAGHVRKNVAANRFEPLADSR